MFPCFIKLPIELRKTIWRFAMPAEQPRKITFDSFREGLILHRKSKLLSTILHVCHESRTYFLENCTILYGTQPIYVNPAEVIITLRTGTLWDLFILSHIVRDNEPAPRRFAVFSEVFVQSLRSFGGSYYAAGSLANLLIPFYHLKEHAKLQRSDTVLVVHKVWNEQLVNTLDIVEIEKRYHVNIGWLHGGFPQISGQKDIGIEDFPVFKHVTLEEFRAL